MKNISENLLGGLAVLGDAVTGVVLAAVREPPPYVARRGAVVIEAGPVTDEQRDRLFDLGWIETDTGWRLEQPRRNQEL